MYFVVILMVFVISYAIASHSILFPNSPLTGDTIIAVIRRSYWNIYGELFLEEIEGKGFTLSMPVIKEKWSSVYDSKFFKSYIISKRLIYELHTRSS